MIGRPKENDCLLDKRGRYKTWSDIVIYFLTEFPNKTEYTHIDILNYSYFNYLTVQGINSWNTTYAFYKDHSKDAKTALNLYNAKYLIKLIDLFYNNYKVLGYTPIDNSYMSFSLRILYGKSYEWLKNKLVELYNIETSEDIKYRMKRITSKPQSQWTFEEYQEFKKLTEELNGKKV